MKYLYDPCIDSISALLHTTHSISETCLWGLLLAGKLSLSLWGVSSEMMLGPGQGAGAGTERVHRLLAWNLGIACSLIRILANLVWAALWMVSMWVME